MTPPQHAQPAGIVVPTEDDGRRAAVVKPADDPPALAPLVQRPPRPVQPDRRLAWAEFDGIDVRRRPVPPAGVPFPVREQAPQLDPGQFADDPAVEGKPVRSDGVADHGDDRALTHVTMVNAITRRRNAKSMDAPK